MTVVDAFLYSYDHEAVKVRMDVLKDVVDVHVAVQGNITFQGDRREQAEVPEGVLTGLVPLPVEGTPWDREVAQRNACVVGIEDVDPDDHWIIVSDGDEIPHPDAIRQAINEGRPMTLLTDARSWYADLRYPDREQLWHQPVIGRLRDFEQAGGANNVRWSRMWPAATAVGWHLSGLGDAEWQQNKVKTFAHAEYKDACDDLGAVEARRVNRRDFLNRFDLEKTDDLPPGLAENFPHLLEP